jgi:hypothetical protein
VADQIALTPASSPIKWGQIYFPAEHFEHATRRRLHALAEPDGHGPSLDGSTPEPSIRRQHEQPSFAGKVPGHILLQATTQIRSNGERWRKKVFIYKIPLTEELIKNKYTFAVKIRTAPRIGLVP